MEEYVSSIPAPVLDLLQQETTLVLSTVSSQGESSIAPVFYYLDRDLYLYWYSSSKSEHSLNLLYNPIVAASVYRSTSDWKQIRGVQMRGPVERIVSAKERESIMQAYCDRFKLGRIFHLAINKSTLYRLEPTWIRYLDNGVHFGYKKEYRKRVV